MIRQFLRAFRPAAAMQVGWARDEHPPGFAEFARDERRVMRIHREEESGALMMHPAAREIWIVGLMIKLILVHRYAILRTRESEEDYIAIHALLAGFEDHGPMKLHPGEFDGHIEHMMAAGENYVPMHAYRFNHHAIDNLIRDLWVLWHGGRELTRADRTLRLKVDFTGMVDPAFLDAEVERM